MTERRIRWQGRPTASSFSSLPMWMVAATNSCQSMLPAPAECSCHSISSSCAKQDGEAFRQALQHGATRHHAVPSFAHRRCSDRRSPSASAPKDSHLSCSTQRRRPQLAKAARVCLTTAAAAARAAAAAAMAATAATAAGSCAAVQRHAASQPEAPTAAAGGAACAAREPHKP